MGSAKAGGRAGVGSARAGLTSHGVSPAGTGGGPSSAGGGDADEGRFRRSAQCSRRRPIWRPVQSGCVPCRHHSSDPRYNHTVCAPHGSLHGAVGSLRCSRPPRLPSLHPHCHAPLGATSAAGHATHVTGPLPGSAVACFPTRRGGTLTTSRLRRPLAAVLSRPAAWPGGSAGGWRRAAPPAPAIQTRPAANISGQRRRRWRWRPSTRRP